jgi:hypothetical protein
MLATRQITESKACWSRPSGRARPQLRRDRAPNGRVFPHGNLIYCVLGLVIFGGFTIFDFNRLRRAGELGPDRRRHLPRHLQRLPVAAEAVRSWPELGGSFDARAARLAPDRHRQREQPADWQDLGARHRRHSRLGEV